MSSMRVARSLTREQRAVLTRIQQICEFWEIEPDELRGRFTIDPPPPSPVATTKYCHPVTGETWNGVGVQPDWLRRALLQEGYRVAELLAASP